MHSYWLLFLSLVLAFFSCHDKTTTQARLSLLDQQPAIIQQDGPAIFQYWEFSNEPYLWETVQAIPNHLALYRDSLALKLGEDVLAKAVNKEQYQGDDILVLEDASGARINASLVHSGTVGSIHPISHLEAEILNYLMSRYPLLGHPTEFHGFIMGQDSLNRVRVYFASSDTPWPPKEGIIRDAVERDLSNGWTLMRHLHNHYEPDSNNYVGILAPSMADAHYYKNLHESYGVDKALITNGFHTVEIDHTAFSRFASH